MDSMREKLLASMALVGLTLAVYGQVVTFDFVRYDDPAYVTGNAMVQKGITAEGLRWAWTTGHFSNWHPLTWMSLMLDVSIWGDWPGGFHATNLLLHIGGVLLLFLTVARLSPTPSCAPAFFVAAIYAVHPLHAESVAWVAERKGILSTFFFMLCLWLYVHYCEKPGRFRFALLALAMTCGLLAKQMLVTLPVLLLLLDFWPLGRVENFRRRVTEKLPLFALAAVFSIFAYFAQSGGGALSDLETTPLTGRVENAVCSIATYLGKAIWPTELSPVYPLLVEELTPMRVGIAMATVLALLAVMVMSRRRWPQWTFAIAWYLIALLPVCGLVQIGSHARADRYTDIPLIGVWWAMVLSVYQLVLARVLSSRVAFGIGLVVAAGLAVCGFRQAHYWSDSRKLFERAVTVDPNNYLAMNNLGLVYRDAGLADDALEMFQRSLQVRPKFVPALVNLGNLLADGGEAKAAIEPLTEAALGQPDNATIHASLGRAFFLAGQYHEAETACRLSLSLDPNLAIAHSNLGSTLMEQGIKAEGLGEFEIAVRLAPDDLTFRFNLAAGYVAMDQPPRAKAELDEIVRRRPDHARAKSLLESLDKRSGKSK